MKLVLLAAGHGRRFGGLKQIAPVGPHGEAIMDYTARSAAECGFDGIVLVVREEIRAEILAHVAARWSLDIPVEAVAQPDRLGTAYAVACTRPVVDGPFGVANADDLYEPDALARLRDHFTGAAGWRDRGEHVLVAYQLGRTVLTDAEVKRGICVVGSDDGLRRVEEHRVKLREDGLFEAMPLAHVLDPAGAHGHRTVLAGSTPVSMNLWGFAPSVYEILDEATARFEPDGPDEEVLLPEVLGASVASGRTTVAVASTSSRCYGVTHKEDVLLVRDHLEVAESGQLAGFGPALFVGEQ